MCLFFVKIGPISLENSRTSTSNDIKVIWSISGFTSQFIEFYSLKARVMLWFFKNKTVVEYVRGQITPNSSLFAQIFEKSQVSFGGKGACFPLFPPWLRLMLKEERDAIDGGIEKGHRRKRGEATS